MIKAIIFDLGGVIFKSDNWSFETREKLSKKWKINSRLFQDFWFERKDSMVTGKLSEENYLNELISSFNLSFSINELKKIIRNQNIIDEKMLEILILLKQKYPLFALTNDVREWIEYRIRTFDLKKYFDLIISSSDIGCSKPGREIYENLIEQSGMSPNELLFVDNREENLKPAEELGIKTFHFKDREEFNEFLKIKEII